MARPTLFGMVSTRASQAYTLPALQSFLRNTEMGSQDRLVLIDNDGSMQGWTVPCERIVPIQPRGFAANVNALMDMANEYEQDLCFLSNDVYFTPGWRSGLSSHTNETAILIPDSNALRQYKTASGLEITPRMDLRATIGKADEIDDAARFHVSRFAGTYSVSRIMPFYVFHVSREIYQRLGYLDTSFGAAGAEDVDYQIGRAHV